PAARRLPATKKLREHARGSNSRNRPIRSGGRGERFQIQQGENPAFVGEDDGKIQAGTVQLAQQPVAELVRKRITLLPGNARNAQQQAGQPEAMGLFRQKTLGFSPQQKIWVWASTTGAPLPWTGPACRCFIAVARSQDS